MKTENQTQGGSPLDETPCSPSSFVCECGCGEIRVKPESMTWKKFLSQKYINGHWSRDPRNQEAWRENRRKSAAKALGRKEPMEVRMRKSERIKKAWSEGKYEGSKVGGTPKQMDAIRGKIDMEKLKAGNSVRMKKQMAEWMADGTRAKHEEKRLAVLIGCDGWGKAKRGRLDHVMAKVWHIRDPRGRTHRFSNLNEWARKNENLFEDDRQSAKLPFWYRIACGISQLDGKNGTSCSYKGWVLVGKQEYIIEGGKDPLGRDVDSLENT
jgi:hypothetical protein